MSGNSTIDSDHDAPSKWNRRGGRGMPDPGAVPSLWTWAHTSSSPEPKRVWTAPSPLKASWRARCGASSNGPVPTRRRSPGPAAHRMSPSAMPTSMVSSETWWVPAGPNCQVAPTTSWTQTKPSGSTNEGRASAPSGGNVWHTGPSQAGDATSQSAPSSSSGVDCAIAGDASTRGRGTASIRRVRIPPLQHETCHAWAERHRGPARLAPRRRQRAVVPMCPGTGCDDTFDVGLAPASPVSRPRERRGVLVPRLRHAHDGGAASRSAGHGGGQHEACVVDDRPAGVVGGCGPGAALRLR